MGFEIVEGVAHTVWAPIVNSDTLYGGQLVYANNEGVSPLGAASGAYDTSNKHVPYGLVIGTNLDSPLSDNTYSAQYITDATPLASATEFFDVEGVWSKGDKQAMVKLALITPETVLRGQIFNSSFGTAPTQVTVTTGDANGVSATVGAVDVAGVANLGCLYFRSGANRGLYRVTDDTSATALTWDKATRFAVAVGDTLVRVNLRPIGLSRAQFDS